jgi:hypothetical protein
MKGFLKLSVAIAVLLVWPAATAFAQCGMCGDAGCDGEVTINDVSRITEYLYYGGALTCPDYADVDGYPGITNNDLMFVVAHKFVTYQPLICPPLPGAQPPVSDDTLAFRNTWIPQFANADKWQVQVWGIEVSDIRGLAIPIEFSLPGHTIELDSISSQYSRHGAVGKLIDNPNGRALIYHDITITPGEGEVVTMWFDIDPAASDEQIQIEIGATYPPSSELIYTGYVFDEFYGFVPTVLTPTCEVWGDLNNTGGLSTLGDIYKLQDYLWLTGTPPEVLFQSDVTGDGVIDILDYHSMICEQFICLDHRWDYVCCNLLGGPQPLFADCEPHTRQWGDPGAPLGGATVTFDGADVVVTDVPVDGPGGARIYPADHDPWVGIRMDLEYIDLSYTGAEVQIRFVGHDWSPSQPPDPNDYYPEGSWLLGTAGLRQVGSAVEIEADYDAAGSSDVIVRAYHHGIVTAQDILPGGTVVAEMTAIAALPSISRLEVSGKPPYTAVMYFDEEVSLTLATLPPVTVPADRIEFTAPSETVACDGIGPVDVRAKGPSNFAVRNIEEWEPPCYAYGDVNNSVNPRFCGCMTIGDVSLVLDHLQISHSPMDSPPDADITGDCVVDLLDYVSLACVLGSSDWDLNTCDLVGGECPLATCCNPISRFPGDLAVRLGDATMTVNAPTVTVNDVGTSGADGVRYYPDDTKPTTGSLLRLNNVDLEPDGSAVALRMTGYSWIQPALTQLGWIGLVGSTTLRNDGGVIEIGADYSPVGDPDVVIRAYLGGVMVAAAEVPGGTVIAEATAVTALPHLKRVGIQAKYRHELTLEFDRAVEISFPAAPVIGSVVIDRLHLIADDATDNYNDIGPLDIRGTGMDWFEIHAATLDFCCGERVGDVNSSGSDMPTIGDISVLIEARFIHPDLNCVGLIGCFNEADINQSGGENPACSDLTIGDVSLLIDYLFIAGPENSTLYHCLDAGSD